MTQHTPTALAAGGVLLSHATPDAPWWAPLAVQLLALLIAYMQGRTNERRKPAGKPSKATQVLSLVLLGLVMTGCSMKWDGLGVKLSISPPPPAKPEPSGPSEPFDPSPGQTPPTVAATMPTSR